MRLSERETLFVFNFIDNRVWFQQKNSIDSYRTGMVNENLVQTRFEHGRVSFTIIINQQASSSLQIRADRVARKEEKAWKSNKN